MTARYGSLTLQIKALADLSDTGSAYADVLLSASGSQSLSKIGRGSFTMSARAYTELTAINANLGQVAYVYVTDQVASGAAMDVATFIMQDVTLSTGKDGSMVTVSGPGIEHQLTYASLDNDAIDDGAGGVDTTDIASIMAYAPSGWTNTGGNTTNGTYHASRGNNVMELLIAAAKQSGEIFRLSSYSPPAKTIHWLASADSSGVTLRMPDAPIDYDGNATVGIILSMREAADFSQVVTRIRPYGAGVGSGRLDITDIDAGDTGGDPAWVDTTFASNLIVNSTLETSLGYTIQADVDFSHIRADDTTDSTQLTTAAVALWNEGIAFLEARDDSKKTYDVECVVPVDLLPGQTVTITYTEYEGGITGGNAIWSVNSAFTIHEVKTRVGNSGDLAGVRITRLTVGESIVPRASGASTVINAAKTARETTRKAETTTTPGSVTESREINTDSPLTGGGDLSANRSIGLGTLSSFGSSNQVIGVKSVANDIEYKTVTAGTGISIGHGAGSITITNTGSTTDLSGLAFVTVGNTGSLSAERALTAGDGLDLSDGGGNSTVTLTVDVTELLGDGLTESSNNFVLGTPSTLTVSTSNGVTASSHTHTITTSSNPGGAVILASDANSRLRLAGLGIGAPSAAGNVMLANGGAVGVASDTRIIFDTGNDEIEFYKGDIVLYNDSSLPRLYFRRGGDVQSTESDIYAAGQLGIAAENNLYVFIDGSASTSDGYFVIAKDSDNISSSTELMRVQETGELGLGTNAPGQMIEVSDGATDGTRIRITNSDTGGQSWDVQSTGSTFGGGAGCLAINEVGTGTRFTIDSDGHVGIGTTSPAASALLELSSTSGALLLPRMNTTNRNALTAVDGMVIYNTTNNVVEAYENGSWVDL